MANFRILLESGAPDGILLEDGTGVIILEESTGADGPFSADSVFDVPAPSNRRQRGFIEFSQSLVLILAAVAGANAIGRVPWHQLPVLKREFSQVDQAENFLPLTAAPAALPFTPEDIALYERAVADAQDFIDGRVIVESSPRDAVQQPPTQRTRSQQVEPYLNALPLTAAPAAAPFVVEDLSSQVERKLYQQIDQPIDALLIQWPFLPPDSGWDQRKREYQQVEQSQNYFAFVDLLEAPFVFQDIAEQYPSKKDYWPLFETSEFPAPFEILAAPFVPEENGFTYRKNEYQQVEQQPNPFAIRGNLEAPFEPIDYPNPTCKKRDARDWQYSNVFAQSNLLALPFTPVDYPNPTQHKPDSPDYVQGSLDLVAMPFPASDTASYYAQKLFYQQVEQEDNEFDEYAILEVPFIPEEFPQTGQAKRDAQDYTQSSLDLTAMPFPSWDVGYYERKDEYQQIEQQQNYFAFSDLLEAPFVPEAFENPYAKKLDAQDFVAFYFDAAGAFAPFTPVDVGYSERKYEYQQVEQQPNYFAFSNLLEEPFASGEWPLASQKKRDHWPLFETSEFPAPFQVLEAPFTPVEFPQTGQAKRDAQDFTQSSLDLIAMPFQSWDVGYSERKDEYQQVEQQPNVFAYNDLLEAPFIPEAFENPYAKKPDAQDFIAFYFDTASAFAPFTPVTWPEFERKNSYQEQEQPNPLLILLGTLEVPFVPEAFPNPEPRKRDQWPLFETSEFPAPFQILEEPFIPAMWPEFERLPQYQDEQQPNPFAYNAILSAPFIPVEFPQTGQAKRDAQDWQWPNAILIQWPFLPPDNGWYERKDEYQQIHPDQNYFAFTNTLEAPFIPEFNGWYERKRNDHWPLFETSEFPAPFGILEEPFIPVMWPEFERLPNYQEDQQQNPLAYFGVLAAPFVPVDFPQTGQAKRDAQDWQLASIAITAMPFPSADLGYYAAKLIYQQVEQQPNVFAYNDLLEAPFIPEAFPNPEPRKQDSPDLIVFYFDETNAFNPFVPVEFPQTGQAKRDAQDWSWYYFDAANAFAPFTPVTWPEHEQKRNYQDYQQRSLDLVAMPFPSWDVGYYERKEEYKQIEQQPNYFAFSNMLSAPFTPYDFPQPDRTRWSREAQDFILFYFDAANAIAPFVPTPNDWYERKRPYHQIHPEQNHFVLENLLALPFMPSETAQDTSRVVAVPVEIYLNLSGLYAAAGQPFTPAIFETPQVKFAVQDFTSGSLALTAMPFPSAELAQAPYARPQQQIEQFQNVVLLYIGFPFIPTEMGWYEAKTQEHTVDEPQNLYPLHDLPVFDPFVPYDWPQTKQTKRDFEQQQYPSFNALLLSRRPGRAFCVDAHNRNYIVEPQPRVYCVEAVDRIYIVVENARIYYAEPVDRVYKPED